MKYIILHLFILISFISRAQLAITEGGVEYIISFDATFPNVSSGQFDGEGFGPSPSDGQLNSNAWAITGTSAGDMNFGDSKTVGVFANGTWNSTDQGSNKTDPGIYSFVISTNNNALGVQPDNADFTPGAIILKVKNQTVDGFIEAIEINYDALEYNDENNSNSLKFAISKDNVDYIEFPELDYITEEGKAGGNNEVWKKETRTLNLNGLVFPPGEDFYLRWTFDVEWENFDVLANGNNDKQGIDNIIIEVDTTNNPAPLVEDIAYFRYPTSVDVVSVSAKVYDVLGEDIESVNIKYWVAGESDTSSVLTTNTGNIYSGNIPALNNLDSVYFKVQATDISGAIRTSEAIGYLVRDPVTTTLPYSQPFDLNLADCYSISAKGDLKEWYWKEAPEEEVYNKFAEVSGYYSGEAEEDWLVLPGVNFNGSGNEVMSFVSYYNFGSDDVGSFDLLYSLDYPGAGLPTGFTWDTLEFVRPNEKLQWYYSEIIKLPDTTGLVYIAFKYTNPGYDYRTWRIDDILIESNVVADPEPTNYPENFAASGINGSTIVTSWTDSQGGELPVGYHVQMNQTGTFTAPTDSVPITDDLDFKDGTGSRNFFYGFESITWPGLDPNETYYFAIYPYSNSGDIIDYKTGGEPRADTITIPGPLSADGDIIITEFMSDPRDVDDAYGEWIELFNTTDSAVNINGWTIESSGSDGLETHTIINGTKLNIAPKGFLVLGNNIDTLTNGGVPVDYEYKNIFMSNTQDTIRLFTDGGNFIDFIEWDDGSVWENPEARTLMFIGLPGQDNNDGTLWRPAMMREKGYTTPVQSPTNLSEHDLGSPGTNGMYQNLNIETTWTGTGDWSNGNRDGFNNWSNGSPGRKTKVTIDGNVFVDMPTSFPALSGELIINAGDTLIIEPTGSLSTVK